MFAGVYTAIVTPFREDGEIDWDCLKDLVEFQIEGNVAGIVPCGTTGESPTLSHEEHRKVIKRVVEWVGGRCKVIAGTGSNSTAEAIELSRHAEKDNADACLIVNPYYNKPTQEGLYRHFRAIAESVDIPIILYNIKGRTAVNVETDTLLRLICDCQNIAGVKEASGDINQMKDVLNRVPKRFDVLSGDDNMTLELIKLGGKGVISVASNLVPEKIVSLVDAALKKDKKADAINNELAELFRMLFIETNPIPVKAAMAMKGLCKESYRLPMCELRPENRKNLKSFLEGNGYV
ncbi:4-hydroxy-tetrahydrodipicolinate synthase [Candidatus Woesearchaeota archaeon]|nr:4-hydroxy-tetrahydrodipicolinate synthase [Candidatus Woesearchaeota archaeon]